ncbi:endonuclease/exonuclease/phosphatase family protein [Tundrisphaera lichenicola]|uniref:endonuclease/exonuclease/phosphatase family protein n=1 Tax=Tundrisphaera lichenicola TaxID=2029860 RepID=UPI003EBB4641
MPQTILFWNCNTQKGRSMLREPDKADIVARLVVRRRVDVLILAECDLPSQDLLDAFERRGLAFQGPAVSHPRLKFFLCSSELRLEPVLSDDRLLMYRLAKRGFQDVTIGGIHLYGRRDAPEEGSRLARMVRHNLTLKRGERAVGHRRTVLVGDFNMNPFEMGMIDPINGFGAKMTWELAEIHSRGGPEADAFFFNPMWSLMGRSGVPGTYYWDSSDPYNIHWHCLDGVLIRPDLRGIYRDDSLEIVDSIPDVDGQDIPMIRLAKKHWQIEYSDHLPILFDLEMPSEEREGRNV